MRVPVRKLKREPGEGVLRKWDGRILEAEGYKQKWGRKMRGAERTSKQNKNQ